MSSRFDDVREAASNVVDSLRDKPSQVTIIGFGTTAEVLRPAVDVSDRDTRLGLKDQIGDLGTYGGNDGATNWDAALASARQPHLDVVILITDGQPNAFGNPVREGQEAVAAAVATANQLKADGTRLAAVGIDLDQGGERNLQMITGPALGADYYVTDTRGLLRQLYTIVASSCGVPLESLPQPEPADFPWLQAILGTLGGLLLIGLVAFLLLRRRRVADWRMAAPARNRTAVDAATVDHSHLTKQLREQSSSSTTKDSK